MKYLFHVAQRKGHNSKYIDAKVERKKNANLYVIFLYTVTKHTTKELIQEEDLRSWPSIAFPEITASSRKDNLSRDKDYITVSWGPTRKALMKAGRGSRTWVGGFYRRIEIDERIESGTHQRGEGECLMATKYQCPDSQLFDATHGVP